MTESLAELANRSWRDSYRKLVTDVGGEWRDFGSLGAFVSPIPLALANGCLALEPAAPADLVAAVAWLDAAEVSYRVRIDEVRAPGLIEASERLGLVRATEALPGMVLRPILQSPPAPDGVSVARVDHANYDMYVELMIATGVPAPWAGPLFPRDVIDDADSAAFIGLLDGRPAGTSLVVRTGDLAGIFAVGTVESARRRGVGRAVTWAAAAAARDWGCQAVVLQASEMGFPIYRAMGFEPVVDYTRYMRPPPAA